MKRNFLPILILLFSISFVNAQQVNITFEVNTTEMASVDMEGIYLAGGLGFGVAGDNPLVDAGNGIWTITVQRDQGFESHYTFLNGNCPDWSCKEDLAGLPCADPNNFNDRWLPAVMSDTTVLVCFENCADDGSCVQIIPPTLPMDFEDADITYAPIGFGEATSAIVANPNVDADNGSAMVWNVTKPTNSQSWAGASIDLAGPMDFSSTSTIKIKFYSDFSGIPVLLKVENDNGSSSAEVLVNTTVDAGWETLSFDMSMPTTGTFDPANVDYNVLVVFPDFNNIPFLNALPFYFDDAELDIVVSDKPNLPVDFENTALDYGFGAFGNVDMAEIIDNPDPTGNNTSAKVYHISKPEGAETWAGAFFDLENPADLSNPVFEINVWTPEAGTPVLLKMEDSSNGAIATELMMTTTGGGAWETLTFDLSTVGTFDPTHNYDRVVLFPNFGNMGVVGGASYYFDDVAQGTVVATLPTLPITFESSSITYTTGGFGNLNPSVIANPDATGDNTSATVLSLEKTTGAEVWAGASIPLETAIDWTSGTTLSVKVWSPNAGTPFLLKVENIADPTNISAEVLATSVGANTWETLTFDMTTSTVGTFDPSADYDQVVIFPNFGNMGTGTTYYADDFEFFSSPIVLPTLPVNFEDAAITYTNNAFGNANSSVIANPDATGSNTSATVLSLEKTAGAEVWAGTSLPLQSAIDWSLQAGNVLSLKVWSPRADVPILLKIENLASAGATFAEVQKNTVGANAWETLVFNMASHPDFDASVDYDLVAVFADFGNAGAGETFYFDDIMNDVDVAISELDKAKVVVNAFPNPADQIVNVKYSIPVSGNITFTLVDMLGRNAQEVNEGNLYEGNYQTVIDVNGLNSGIYYLVTRLDGEIISTKSIMKK
ncbi:MAG: T9SS type A sorting domain-containing protein [Saprospiraceae bacterium]